MANPLRPSEAGLSTHEPQGGGKRPRPHIRAVDDAPVSDWASFFGDLARGSHTARPDDPVEWRIHDKTHLEFAIDYALRAKQHTWEAYFFVPESFRIHEATYSKKAIYDDLQSYVRYAVPEVPFHELSSKARGAHLRRLHDILGTVQEASARDEDRALAMRALRFFACLVRASGLAAVREVEASAAARPLDPAALKHLTGSFLVSCGAVIAAIRPILDEARSTTASLSDDIRRVVDLADEEISLAIETLCADIAVKLEADPEVDAALPDLAERVAKYAVLEARYRARKQYDSVGSATATKREIEHFEFRRHVLKRFTSSVLWLSLEVREGVAKWVTYSVYALAAMLAMLAAILAGVRASNVSDNFFRYAVIVVLAYAVKDRLKAFLQEAFSKFVSKRYADRLWTIRDRERRRDVGSVRERAGFVPFRRLPAPVLDLRRITLEHALEEHARPERVIWHRKDVALVAPGPEGTPLDSPMLTEIFRLNIGHWLSHTDDPRRRIVFADPKDASVYSAMAPRVYNINVIYRLAGPGSDGEWHRIRVVVSRKGIIRIEPVANGKLEERSRD